MKIRWKTVFFSILLFVFLFFVAPIILASGELLSIPEFQKLLSIVFSWPIAVLIISLIFVTHFSDAIDSLIKNIGVMKLPGGFEFQQQNQPPPVNETDKDSDDLHGPSNQNELVEIDEVLSESETEIEIHEGEIKLSKQQYSKLVNDTRSWKFSYLNKFFINQTKNVLHWFSMREPQTRQSYDNLWMPYILDQNQRNLILGVLLQYWMLNEINGLIQITDEGYAFLQFIGYIPSSPIQKAT